VSHTRRVAHYLGSGSDSTWRHVTSFTQNCTTNFRASSSSSLSLSSSSSSSDRTKIEPEQILVHVLTILRKESYWLASRLAAIWEKGIERFMNVCGGKRWHGRTGQVWKGRKKGTYIIVQMRIGIRELTASETSWKARHSVKSLAPSPILYLDITEISYFTDFSVSVLTEGQRLGWRVTFSTFSGKQGITEKSFLRINVWYQYTIIHII